MYAIKLASAALSCLSPRVSCIRNLTTVTKFTRVFTILLQVWVLNSIPHQSRRRLHIGSLQGIFTVRWRNEVTDVETSLSNKKLRGVYNIRPIMRRQLGWIDGVTRMSSNRLVLRILWRAIYWRYQLRWGTGILALLEACACIPIWQSIYIISSEQRQTGWEHHTFSRSNHRFTVVEIYAIFLDFPDTCAVPHLTQSRGTPMEWSSCRLR